MQTDSRKAPTTIYQKKSKCRRVRENFNLHLTSRGSIQNGVNRSAQNALNQECQWHVLRVQHEVFHQTEACHLREFGCCSVVGRVVYDDCSCGILVSRWCDAILIKDGFYECKCKRILCARVVGMYVCVFVAFALESPENI